MDKIERISTLRDLSLEQCKQAVLDAAVALREAKLAHSRQWFGDAGADATRASNAAVEEATRHLDTTTAAYLAARASGR